MLEGGGQILRNSLGYARALGRLAKMFSVHFGFLVVNPVFCRLPFWDTQQLGFSFLLQHVATMILAMDNS